MAKKEQPSADLMKDLKIVFKKHNWSGGEIGMQPVRAAADATISCPPGKSPQLVTYKTASGKWVTELQCVDDDD
jgi:hypothetical protein